jgi:gluconate 2-dehydrogenase alpha chain
MMTPAVTIPLLALNSHEARTAAAVFERLFPADEHGPGAAEIGVVQYVDRALAGAYRDHHETYRLGLAALDGAARALHGSTFADCTPDQQDSLLRALEVGELPDFATPPQGVFFELLRAHVQEGLFADPAYGGNRDKQGWAVIGHPGVWLENSAEENLTPESVTKGGRIQSLADLGFSLHSAGEAASIPGYDPQRGAQPPGGPADVVLVGLGGMGGVIAPVLAKAGLKVVALEAGAWRTQKDFIPDELGAAYYCRANMGPKFQTEIPRWRRNDGEATQEATFSLGRMMNSVGGSIIHYGAWLRRFHPHHFRMRSHVRDQWGLNVLPENNTLTDWPISYEDLDPYFYLLEDYVGVAGDETNPFLPRTKPYPMPPMRPFRLGEFFRKATRAMGLHPHPVPVGMNSVPYDGRPATTYTAWNNGFGSYTGDKWHPALTSVPEALATGNLEVRTHCRVVRLLTDSDGHAGGVEYLDANGQPRVQLARTVILCSYTYENIRLMLLSGDARHPNGLGNNAGQVGKYYMTKMFAHVDGYFPDVVFNRHTGPAAQGVVLDDFLAADFESLRYGFIGGATLGAEQQFLPIQISREALPPDIQRWGKPYKDHVRNWQHYGVVRIQPDTLSYTDNFLDLDPVYRDRSGLGMPVIRVTYDIRQNEHKLADWMEGKAEDILRAMGAVKTWRGARFTGVGSSHDLGGCRMGDDPNTSVVNPELGVHDTPGLYVFGGATFPTCPGINPTLTLWAVCYRAAEQLVARLRSGEER